MMSIQEAFDKAVLGVVQQGDLAITAHGSCFYRSRSRNDNRKCAIGHLIPDDKYNSDFEGRGAQYTTIAKLIKTIVDVSDVQYDIFVDLQRAHDYSRINCNAAERIHSFITKTTELAAKYRLTMPELPKVE